MLDRHSPHRIVLTGAAGFVGSHILEYLLEFTAWTFACPVTFRHEGRNDRLRLVLGRDARWRERADVILCDLRGPVTAQTAALFGRPDAVLNVASLSSVDASITAPREFTESNLQIMLTMLEYARTAGPKVFLHMSSCGIYGPAGAAAHRESDPARPSNPYAAGKAAQDALASAWNRTYGIPVIITSPANVIGSRQDRGKFFPRAVAAILDGRPVPVHVSADGTPGSRSYLPARALADAWCHLLTRQIAGRHDAVRVNISGQREAGNDELAMMIGAALGRPVTTVPVPGDRPRPGHDLRYALDGSVMALTGWEPPGSFTASVNDTARWYAEHPQWLHP